MFKFKASKFSASPETHLGPESSDSDSLSSSTSASTTTFRFQNVLGSNPANAQIRLGRPPGSANISQSATLSREHSTDPSRKRGRPPGTGRLQRQAERLRCLREERSRERSKEAVQSSERMPKKRRLDEADNESAVSTPTTTSATRSTRSTIDLTAAPPEILPHPEHAEGIETGRTELSLDDEVDAGEGEIGLAHNGLGVEDEDDDESYDGVDQNANDTNRPRRIPNPLPEWLETEFKRCIQASHNRDPNGLPQLYHEHKSFYFPRPATFFTLTQNHKVPSPFELYDYAFFLWDPGCLVKDGIPCPNCGTKLTRHGPCERPRRFVDFERTVWVIGYRYKCPTCVNKNSGKRTVTFRSWNKCILDMLPKWLVNEFPAHLSHRSGLSRGVFTFMRTCFQHGFGAKQFANALRVQQLQRYDELHLQYLYYMWQSRNLHHSLGHSQIEPFLPFQDHSPKGFSGFVPSAQWLRDTYDEYLESHVQDIHQHTSMLSANVIAIDHSFKATKQVTKINGVQVFVALLTLTNEKGEIRQCDLVASKSHSQFEIALSKMSEHLKLYGHSQPAICYTDNMADQPFMESVFPSLREGVNPVENHSNLEPLVIPPDVQIITSLQAVAQIDDAMRSIVQLLPDHEDDKGLVIGFDAEYNVEVSSRGYVTGRGQTAIVQIACGKQIFVLQIGRMLAAGQLPAVFKQVLMNPRIIKVGRNVGADLKYLERSISASSGSFVGALDLAELAKEQLIVKRATIGLADLCACTLGKRLNKNVSDRISTLWENETLSEEQIRYAALDAYASLRIYEYLISVPAPSPLPPNSSPAPSTPILLFGDDKSRLIARGCISKHYTPHGMYDNLAITDLRCVIEVQQVYVPGAVISTHRKQALENFAPSPPLNIPPAHSDLSDSTASFIDDASDESIGGSLLDNIDSPCQSFEKPMLTDYAVDPESKAEGDEILRRAALAPWVTDMRSRIKKDPFHVFNMFYISVAHGLRVDFSRALRDAIFIPDPADQKRIEVWGLTQNPPLSWDYLVRSRPKWVWAHCKRTIPPPEQLYPLVERVFRVYGPLKDAKTGSPLFNAAAWAVSRNVLELVRKGFLSDPIGIALYTPVGLDSKAGGLPIYRCFRGTNFTEGGVHRHFTEHLPQYGASIRHVHASLQDFVLCHNLRVGTFNSTGQPWGSHYSIWLTNELQELLLTIRHHNLIQDLPTGIIPKGWINGNFYLPTTEVIGILPIPDTIRRDSGMLDYRPDVDHKQTHWFVASLQGTRRAVLPIANSYEEGRFREYVATNTGSSEPRWDNIVRAWNTAAITDNNLSYKLIEHLRLYYNGDWKTLSNIKQTLAQTAEDRKRAKKPVNDLNRIKMLPAALEAPLTLHSVQNGLRESRNGLPDHTDQISESASGAGEGAEGSSRTSSIIPNTSMLPPEPPSDCDPTPAMTPPNLETVPEIISRLAVQRVEDRVQRPTKKKPRQPRRCKKCDKGEDCNGRSNVRLCPNVCRDCGRKECDGRNSKKPHIPCENAM
ncbi:hypothetical protein F5880DRAFT_1616319 [Lentinula raphanica]|nr:hypothetical protein F5880DRAFT_1616319 [Lentinula raphanica]